MGEGGHAVHPGHAQIQEDQIHPVARPFQRRQALPAVRALQEIVGLAPQGAGGPPARHRLVVADQDAGLSQLPGSRRQTWKTILPGSFTTSIVPPSSPTRWATRGSPSPVPPSSPFRTNGWKRRPAISGGIAGPAFSVAKTMPRPSRWRRTPTVEP